MIIPSSHAAEVYISLLELKGCFNPAMVIPVAVQWKCYPNTGNYRMQRHTLDTNRWQPFGCKLSSACDVIVHEWNAQTDVASIIQIILAGS